VISLTVTQLEGLLAQFGWPFVRILSFVATEPVLGNNAVSFRVKVALSLFIAVLLAPVLPAAPSVAPASAAGLLILAQQVLIGTAMGFAARIVVSAAEMAGQLAGLQMGLGFAVFFDPQGGGQTPLVAQFFGLIAVLVLLATNGHYLLLTALRESFAVLPVSAGPLAPPGFLTLVEWGGEIFRMGVMLSLPVVGAVLIANVAIGVLTRAAPQLNVFAVGFPITLAVGFVMLYLSMPIVVPLIATLGETGAATVMQVLERLRPGP
jgi:flagellar biosynthetic protein FliR